MHHIMSKLCIQRAGAMCLTENEWSQLSNGALSSFRPRDLALVHEGVTLAGASGGLIIGGLVRDQEDAIDSLRYNVEALASFFHRTAAVILENDSVDRTRTRLDTWSKELVQAVEPRHPYTLDLYQCGQAANASCILGQSNRWDALQGTASGFKKVSVLGKLPTLRNWLLTYIVDSPRYAGYTLLLIVDVDLGISLAPLGLMHALAVARGNPVASGAHAVYPSSFGSIVSQYDQAAFDPQLEADSDTATGWILRAAQRAGEWLCELSAPDSPARFVCRSFTPFHWFLIMYHSRAADQQVISTPMKVASAFNGATLYPLERVRASGARYNGGPHGQDCEHLAFHRQLCAYNRGGILVDIGWRLRLSPTRPAGPSGWRHFRMMCMMMLEPMSALVLLTSLLAHWGIAAAVSIIFGFVCHHRRWVYDACVAIIKNRCAPGNQFQSKSARFQVDEPMRNAHYRQRCCSCALAQLLLALFCAGLTGFVLWQFVSKLAGKDELVNNISLFYYYQMEIQRGHDVDSAEHAKLRDQCRAYNLAHGFPSASKRVSYYLGDWAGKRIRSASFRQCNFSSQTRVATPTFEPSYAVPMDNPFCFDAERWQSLLDRRSWEHFTFDATGLLIGQSLYAREMASAILGNDKCAAAFLDLPLSPSYVADAGRCECSLPVMFGDSVLHPSCDSPVPIVAKARLAGRPGRHTILFKMNRKRHFSPMAMAMRLDKTPYHLKRDQAVWRGAATGNPASWRTGSAVMAPRAKLLNAYSANKNGTSLLDIALSKVPPQISQDKAEQKWRVDPVGLEELLGYKLIIVLEGNDVSTSLKWVLASTSTVLMPKPKIVSWAMEDTLKPYVHYVPLRDDLSDVHTKVAWCLAHPKFSAKIGLNGRCFAQRFLDTKHEAKVQRQVLMGAFAAAHRTGTCCRCTRPS